MSADWFDRPVKPRAPSPVAIVQPTISTTEAVTLPANTYDTALYTYRELRDLLERDLLRDALLRHNGNVSRAAKFLRVPRGFLHRRMKALHISREIIGRAQVPLRPTYFRRYLDQLFSNANDDFDFDAVINGDAPPPEGWKF